MAKLLPNTPVEVLQTEQGLRGAWFEGVVYDWKPGSRAVRFTELHADDELKCPLTEWVRVTSPVDGRAATARSPATPGKVFGSFLRIRPVPPRRLPPNSDWAVGTFVEARVSDAWWHGIISGARVDNKVTVSFPDEDDEQVLPVSQLRMALTWDAADDTWLPFVPPMWWIGWLSKVRKGVAKAQNPTTKLASVSPSLAIVPSQDPALPAPAGSPHEALVRNLIQYGWCSAGSKAARKQKPPLIQVTIGDSTSQEPDPTVPGPSGLAVANGHKDCVVADAAERASTPQATTHKVKTKRDGCRPSGCMAKKHECEAQPPVPMSEPAVTKPPLSAVPAQAVDHQPIAGGQPIASDAVEHKQAATIKRPRSKKNVTITVRMGLPATSAPDVTRLVQPAVQAVPSTTAAIVTSALPMLPQWRGRGRPPNCTKCGISVRKCPCGVAAIAAHASAQSAAAARQDTSEVPTAAVKATLKATLKEAPKEVPKLALSEPSTAAPQEQAALPQEDGARVRLEAPTAAPGRTSMMSPRGVTGSSKMIGGTPAWKRLFAAGIVKDGDPLIYRSKRGELLNTGLVREEGIECGHCNRIVTLSAFEFHAGGTAHRPSQYTFMSDGRSLMECAAGLTGPGEKEALPENMDMSDDQCRLCGEGGDLICCDSCPATFHLQCMVPSGNWYCPSCQCRICGKSEFAPEGFNEKTVLICDQCEREYHVGCLRRELGFGLEEIPPGDWYCSEACLQVTELLTRLRSQQQPIDEELSWEVLNSRGLNDSPASARLLKSALMVMQECFHPIEDPRSKQDLIPLIMHSSKSLLMDFSGFFNVILHKQGEVVCVATLRVFGRHLAEMPLIATKFNYRRQGLARRLLAAIEKLLKCLGVADLVLPAINGVDDTWRNSFGFRDCTELERRQHSESGVLIFPHTTFLQKAMASAGPAEDNHFVLGPPPQRLLDGQLKWDDAMSGVPKAPKRKREVATQPPVTLKSLDMSSAVALTPPTTGASKVIIIGTTRSKRAVKATQRHIESLSLLHSPEAIALDREERSVKRAQADKKSRLHHLSPGVASPATDTEQVVKQARVKTKFKVQLSPSLSPASPLQLLPPNPSPAAEAEHVMQALNFAKQLASNSQSVATSSCNEQCHIL
eukprot:jgi/Chlat1/4740/Chrsp308S04736